MGVLQQWIPEDDRTQGRQKESYNIIEEYKEFYSLLLQLGTALQVILLYLYKIHRSLLRSFKVTDHVFAWNPILRSLQSSCSLDTLCRCFSSTFYNRNHLVLHSVLICDTLV